MLVIQLKQLLSCLDMWIIVIVCSQITTPFTVGPQLLHDEVATAFCNHFVLISHSLLISVQSDDLSHFVIIGYPTTLKCYHGHKKLCAIIVNGYQYSTAGIANGPGFF